MKKLIKVVLVVLVGIGIAAGVAASQEGVKHELAHGVADDLVEQYQIAKRNGTKMDVCVRAGAVAEAFLQAHDEGEYATWKKTQRADCARAGLPQ